jgi:uncharacterized repeat protein (TIGR01451 family)
VRPREQSGRPASLAALVLAVIAMGLAPALAPAALAASRFSLTTPYPSVVVAPGASVSFDVTVTTPGPERVALALSGTPDGWTALIHGGGNVVDSIETGGSTAPAIRVDVTVPASATGTADLLLRGTAAEGTQDLALQVRVEAAAAGDVTLTTDFPSLQGPAGQSVDFNLTLSNQSAQDLTFAVNAQGPDGWTVAATLTGQSSAASAVVKAGATSGITVSAQSPAGTPAGTYPIQVVATAGSRQIPGTLQVVVTGSYSLAMSTPDQRLNTNATAGQPSDFVLTVTNGGTAPITNVKLGSTPPTGWTVTFDPPTVASLNAATTQTVTAHIVPSGDAVAGDYVVTMTANGDQSTSATEDIRVTVETSLEWAIVGIALIAIVVIGLWLVFRRYGRR